MTTIAIFASGTGSNALNIHNYFKDNPNIQIDGVYSNNPEAGILKSAPEAGMKVHLFSRSEMKDGTLCKLLLDNGVDYIVLAGFLWLVPENIVEAFPHKIINIHPALLPNYGGKGMYGMHVHNAVIEAGDLKSGISIHEVNKEYDKGDMIFQAEVTIDPSDNAEDLAKKIHQLEYQFFPQVIKQWILN
jgi:phosphoribosylglycinamide formyltransferase-1